MGIVSPSGASHGGGAATALRGRLRHASRAYIFSAALPPAQAAAANEAFKVILDEPWRIERLNQNTKQFIGGLKSMGFDTMLTETAIVPVLCGDDEKAFAMTREAQHNDVFVLPVVSPAVPEGLARLRAELDHVERLDAFVAETREEMSSDADSPAAMSPVVSSSQIFGGWYALTDGPPSFSTRSPLASSA